jgi:hypothetical protein
VAGAHAQPPDDRRLAHTCLAAQQHQPSAPRSRCREMLFHLAEHDFSFKKGVLGG